MFNLLWNKPKPERFSLENLKSLCEQLQHFPGDANEESIISCLKELTQLLIWGDQHDPLLLEHFFEQNVHEHFLKILQSKQDGSLIVQVLQTLNIMFENVRSQESLYFLLSNNYVNRVICLRYDFSNDEILAYYIYLLRTLSFKLTKDTIYFFFNEHLDDFPLYSEAIKFFNHEESMIRIAVRVITLNVYSVNDRKMQDFILDRTTTTYFSNLVWFIGNYGTTVNDMLLHQGEGEFSRMNYYLAEHMDCFYYVNDIIELDVPKINKILISNLLNKLLRPMYLDSLLPSSVAGSTGTKASSATHLTPVVALSLMLHAFHVLKHAPLVSALTSTLFSNQHYSSSSSGNQSSHARHSHPPLSLGSQTVSPDSSRPASPVTSKFHSFGLLGSSPAGGEFLAGSSAFHFRAQTPTLQHPQQQRPSSPSQQNPYKTSIFEYLSRVDNDQLVLPALALIYLAGRNPGVMHDVLLGTDIYPQRLLKSRLLMGNLTSSVPPTRNFSGATSMSRERSSDSILSVNSLGSLPWNFTSPGVVPASTSLFGGAGSTRLRTRTESPLFETEEDNEESRETEELLASESSEPATLNPPPNSTSPLTGTGTAGVVSMSKHPSVDQGLMDSVLAQVAASASALAFSGGAESSSSSSVSKPKSRSGNRRGSKTPSLLGPSLTAANSTLTSSSSATAVSSAGGGSSIKDGDFGQELRPVRTSKEDREQLSTLAYPDRPLFSDEEEASNASAAAAAAAAAATAESQDIPPPLPPRPSTSSTAASNGSADSVVVGGEMTEAATEVATETGPVIQNREDLIDRLVDILCGQAESGAHRFRILSIQMAAEVLIEFVYTKGGSSSGSGKEGHGASTTTAASNSLMGVQVHLPGMVPGATSSGAGSGHNGGGNGSSSESQIGEARLQRLVLAEALFRERVQKGIQILERRKGGESGQVDIGAPLGLLTSRVERALSESKLGMDRQIASLIAESSVVYGPDKDLDKEPDLDPDPELIILFGLDPHYTGLGHSSSLVDGQSTTDDGSSVKSQDRVSTASTGTLSSSTTVRDGKRVKIRNKIKTKMQKPSSGKSLIITSPTQQYQQQHRSQAGSRGGDRMEVMVIRFIKWLHILVQCRQLLSRMAVVTGSPLPPITTTLTAAPSSTAAAMPTLERKPSDLLAKATGSSASGAGAAVSSAHKGLQKALATTATTGSTIATTESSPSTAVHSTASVASLSSRPSSVLSSVESSPICPQTNDGTITNTSTPSITASGPATLSQPGSVSASGLVSSRTLLSATAALEAAAASGSSDSNPSLPPLHPNFNQILQGGLDPLSTSVSEAIRKSGARIKSTMVDPLSAAGGLFRTASSSSASSVSGVMYNLALPSGTTSDSQSKLALPTTMNRADSSNSSRLSITGRGLLPTTALISGGGSTTTTATSTPNISSATMKDPLLRRGIEEEEEGVDGMDSSDGSVKGEEEDGHHGEVGGSKDGFKSILDKSHPVHRVDDQVLKLLDSLGLWHDS